MTQHTKNTSYTTLHLMTQHTKNNSYTTLNLMTPTHEEHQLYQASFNDPNTRRTLVTPRFI